MSKMSDMAMTIEELRNAAAAINDAADWLSRQFSGEPTDAEPAPAKVTRLRFAPCFRNTMPPSSPASIRRTTAHS